MSKICWVIFEYVEFIGYCVLVWKDELKCEIKGGIVFFDVVEIFIIIGWIVMIFVVIEYDDDVLLK